jgi:hypothetical protein
LEILTGKIIRKRFLGRSRHRWEDNVRINLKVIDVNKKNLIVSAQGMYYWRSLLNLALNLGL